MRAQPSIKTPQRKVLLIEDNEDDALLLREALNDVSGALFNLEWVNRLSTGLARLAGGGIDVVLLDLGLPDSQGFKTFARTHASAPQVPIIVLSGLDDETLAITAVREGAQDYLVKGQVDGNLLARALRYAVERQHLRVELTHYVEALQDSQARFRRIIDESVDGILIIDQEGIIRFANPAAEALFGRSAEELLGQPFGFSVTEDQATELDIVTGDQKRLVADMHLTTTEWEGQSARLASLHDITRRKQE